MFTLNKIISSKINIAILILVLLPIDFLFSMEKEKKSNENEIIPLDTAAVILEITNEGNDTLHIGSVGVIQKYTSKLDIEMEKFFFEYFVEELKKRNMYKIADLGTVREGYSYVIDHHKKFKDDYSKIINFLKVDFLFVFEFSNNKFQFKNNKDGNDKTAFDFSFNVDLYSKYLKETESYNRSWHLDEFQDVIFLLPELVNDIEKKSSLITLEGSYPEEAEIFIMNNNDQIIYSHYESSFYQKVKPGKYKIIVQKTGYTPMIGKMKVHANKELHPTYSLTEIDKNRARMFAKLYPGLGHQYLNNRKEAKKWYTIQTTLLASAIYFIVDYFQQKKSYDNLYKIYMSDLDGGTQYHKDLLAYKNNQKNDLNLFFTLSATSLGTWIWNYIDLNKRLKDPNLGRLVINPDKNE